MAKIFLWQISFGFWILFCQSVDSRLSCHATTSFPGSFPWLVYSNCWKCWKGWLNFFFRFSALTMKESIRRPGYYAQNYARRKVLFSTCLSNYYLAIIQFVTLTGSVQRDYATLGWRCYARNYAELRGHWREEAVLFSHLPSTTS